MAEDISVVVGPQPGWLGDMVALHGRYYSEHWQFPTAFEAKVATEAAQFLLRYQDRRDLILSVHDGRMFATLTLDVSDPALAPGLGHLRWFIAAPDAAGRGLGTRLLADAFDHGRRVGLDRIYLTTFEGLGRAARLYEAAGFRLVHAAEGTTWGRIVRELRLEAVLGDE